MGRSTVRRLVSILAALVLAATGGSVAAAAPGQPSIVGGEPAAIEDFPWTVSIFKGEGPWCGASLVAPTKLVSAAHCFHGDEDAEYTAVSGASDLASLERIVSKVDEVWVHPSYQDVTQGYDVAVLTVSAPIDAPPVSLAEPGDEELYDEGAIATTLGWGNTEEGGEPSTELMRVDVPVTSSDTCGEVFGESYLEEAMVCAGYPEGGKDACQGDSGGPFVVDGKLAGVVSWGRGCARPGIPGIYTRLITYSELIKRQLEEDDD